MNKNCFIDNNGEFCFACHKYLDNYDKPILRTPITHPYSYDGYVIYRNGKNSEVTGSCYSDRMYQWNYEKFNKCCMDIFGNKGQYFDSRDPNLIEKFLQKYFDKSNLKLIYIMQWCNQSSGYPLWSFHWNEK